MLLASKSNYKHLQKQNITLSKSVSSVIVSIVLFLFRVRLNYEFTGGDASAGYQTVGGIENEAPVIFK